MGLGIHIYHNMLMGTQEVIEAGGIVKGTGVTWIQTRCQCSPNQDCVSTKVVENVYPYIIGVFHFFENYPAALASFAPNPGGGRSAQRLRANTE